MSNSFKRFLSLALALMMVISMMPTTAFATDGEGTQPDAVVEDIIPEASSEPEEEPSETTEPEEEPSVDVCTHENQTTTTEDATCEADGSVTVTCDDCGEVLSEEAIPAGHKYVDGICELCGEAEEVADEGEEEEPEEEEQIAQINEDETSSKVDFIILDKDGNKYPAIYDSSEVISIADRLNNLYMMSALLGAEGPFTYKVVLHQDVEETKMIEIPADTNVVIDLNGYTLSQTKEQTAGYQMILNDGNLTINDSVGGGKISYTDSGNGGEYISDTIYNRGNLVINGGTIENLSSETVASYGYPHAVDTYSGIRDTSVTINDGVISCESYSAIRMFCVSASNEADLVINGGIVKGAIDMQNGTTAEALGSLTIYGGAFYKNASRANVRFANWNGGATEYGIDAAISGGYFDSGINTDYVPAAANWNGKIITGGTFGADVSTYVADGYEQGDDGAIGEAVVATAVAKIGDAEFATLAEALAAAQAGDEITLLGDVALESGVSIVKSITINGNGYTIAPADASATYNSAIMAGDSGWGDDHGETITLKNVTFSGWKTNYGVVRAQGVTLVADNCDFIGSSVTNAAYAVLSLNYTDATVSGCEFKDNNDRAIDVNYNGDDSEAVVTIDGCTFDGNTTTGAGIVMRSAGNIIVKNSVFTNNEVNTNGNGATLYVGFGAGNQVSGCTFKGNTVTTSHATTKRFASAIFCDGCVVNGNVFGEGNTATRNGQNITTIVAVGAYYGAADISANYWGKAPVLGEDYTIEYTRQEVSLDSYYADAELTEKIEIKGDLSGSGTEADPYVIASLDDLYLFAEKVNGGETFDNQFVKLTADIDLAGAAWTPIGTAANPFKGDFDGGDNTISNLVVSGENNVGFFGYADACTIKNLNINNATVTGVECIGAIAGQVYSTSLVDNCHVSGSIKIEGQTNVGGILGKYYAKVSNSSVVGDGAASSYVKGTYVKSDYEGDNIGGIMGHCGEDNAMTNNTVASITISGTRKVGGIVGIADQNTDVSGCAVRNVVIETTATADYAASKVTTMSIGGLIGQYQAAGSNPNGTITECVVENVDFNNANNVTVSIGAICGGARGGSDGMLAPSDKIAVSEVVVSGVTGANNDYLMPTPSAEISNLKETVWSVTDSENREAFNVQLKKVNAYKSLKVEVYHDDILLTTTTLKDKLIPYVDNGTAAEGFNRLTVNIVLSGEASGSWDTTVETENLTEENIPNYIKVYCDGKLVAEDSRTFDEAWIAAYKGLDATAKPAVAKIGEQGYATLEEAFAAAQAGDTITLTGDVKLAEGLVNEKTITLDLNGCTVSAEITENLTQSFSMITNKGNLTIADSGENGKLSLKYTGASFGYGIGLYTLCNAAGTVNIEGGIVENLTTVSGSMYDAIDNNSTNGTTTLNIEGGKVSCGYIAVRQFCNSTSGENIVNVTGGIVDGGNCSIWRQNPNSYANKGEINVEGGTFTGRILSDDSTGFEAAISGGQFTVTAKNGTSEELLADGYAFASEADANGLYTIVEQPAVAKIGDETYATLQDAIDAAQAGETVTVIADIALTETVTVPAGKTVTLDLNGKTISQIKEQTEGYSMIKNNGTLTINDTVGGGKISYTDTSDGKHYNVSNTIGNFGTLVINGGTIENLSSMENAIEGYPQVIDTNSGSANTSVTINGGKLYCANYSAIRMFCNSKTYTNSVEINGGEIYGRVDFQNPTSGKNLGKLTINGGSFDATVYKNRSCSVYIFGSNTTDGSGMDMTITGGTFAKSVLISNIGDGFDSKFISGGTFSEDVSEYCAEGYKAEQNADGTYGVVEDPTCGKVAKIGEAYYASLEDAAKAIATDGSDTTIEILTDIELDKNIDFNYGSGDVIFTATKPVTIKQTKVADLGFVVGKDMNIVIGENVTFQIYDNASGMYVYYGPSLEISGAITGGQNWGCLYTFNGDHVVTETGKVGVGRVQMGFNEWTVYGEVDTNYLLVEAGTFNANGATINADVIHDSNNGGMRWGASEFNVTNGSAVAAGTITLGYADSVLTVSADSTLTATAIKGAGKIVIDATGMNAGVVSNITADMSGFTGKVEAINNAAVYAAIEDGKIVLKANVAKIGDETYATLQDAIDAAQAGDEIVLLDNLTIESDLSNAAKGYFNIAEDDKIIIDLNGKKITATDKSSGNFILFYNYGELTIKNGTVELTATNDRAWNAQSTIILNRGGNLTIESGSYIHKGGTAMAYVVDNSGNSYGDATTTINGGILNSAYIGIRNRMDTYGANGNGNGIAKLVVNGGEISGKYAVWGQVSSSGCKGEIVITGGKLSGAAGKAALLVDEDAAGEVKTVVSGGTFSDDSVEAYLADGYALIENEDGTYGVKVALPEVVVTDILSSLTENDPELSIALNFAIKDVDKLSEEYLEALFEAYGDYYTDYVLTISGLSDESVAFNANGGADGYLAGQYDAWSENWVSVPFEDVTVMNGESLYIMEYAAKLMGQSGLRFTLAEVAEIVQNFDCGVYFTPEFLNANPNMKVTLELKVFTEDEEGNKINDITVAEKEFNEIKAPAPDVAEVNGTKYKSLQAAIDAAQADETVTVIADIALTETVTVPAGKTVTLDLNGYTISQTKECTASYEMISNKGNLTILDSSDEAGKISFTDTSAGDPSFGWGSYTIRNEGTLEVNDVTIEHLGEQNTPAGAVHMYCAIFQYSGSTTINGGKISTPTYRSVRLWKGDMTINGGEFEGQVWVQAVDNTSKLTIKGGSFAPCGGDGSSVFITNATYDVALAVNGGTFNTKIGASAPAKLAGAIKNGLFTEAAKTGTSAAMLADGFAFAPADEDGWYTIVELPTVAMIGETEYKSLQAAIDAANGNTVVVVDDIVLTETVNVPAGKTVTLDLNGYTVSAHIAEQLTKSFAMINNKGTLTVTDSSDEEEGKLSVSYGGASFGYGIGLYTISNEGGTVNVEGGTIENLATVSGSMYDAIDNNSTLGTATLNIKGGTVSCQYIAVRQFCNSTSYDNIVNVTDGTVEGGNCSIWVQNPGNNAVKGKVNVEGGIFTARILMGTSAGFEAVISDGLFTEAAKNGTDAALLADGYAFASEADANGLYSVVERAVSGEVAYRAYITDTDSREAIQIDLANVYAKESLVVELYDANGNKLTTTSLKAGAVDAAAYTCNIVLWGTASGSWDTEIHAELTLDNIPETIKLYADGTLVDEYTNAFGAGTNVDKTAEYLALDILKPAVAKIGDVEYKSLQAAIEAAQSDDVIYVYPVTIEEKVAYANNENKNITLIGASQWTDGETILTGGLQLGVDNSQCDPTTVTVKGFTFQNKGVLVASQQNVVIENNKFSDITACVDTPSSSSVNAISVIGKNINATVKNNVIDTVESVGIHLRDVKDATVIGNTVNTAKNSSIIINPTSGSNGAIKVQNNTLTEWGMVGEGRAVRISGGATVTVTGNVMTCSNAPEEYVKISGTTADGLKVSANYWDGKNPAESYWDGSNKDASKLFGAEGITIDPFENLVSYYTDAEKTDLVLLQKPVLTGEAAIGSTVYATLGEAIEAATAGQNINILANIATAPTVKINKALNIVNAGGFTLWNADPQAAIEEITADGLVVNNIMGIIFTVSGAPVEKDPVAMIGNVEYTTVEEALKNAKSGDTVVMIDDSDETGVYLNVSGGIKLDLAGHSLTAAGLTAFQGADVYDSMDNKSSATAKLARLIVPQGNLVLQSTNSEISFWDTAANNYVFLTPNSNGAYHSIKNATNNSFVYQFRPGLGYIDTKSVRTNYMADGGADNEVTIKAVVSWQGSTGTTISQTYVFTDALVAQYYTLSTGVLTLSMSGVGSVGEVKVKTIVVTDSGVEFESEELSYNSANY